MLSFVAKFIGTENLRQFALWLLDGLREQLDPESKARLEQYRRDREATEAQIAAEQKAATEAEALLAQLKEQRAVSSKQLAENENALQILKGEVKKIDEEPIKTTTPDDDDLLHRDFRSERNRASGHS